VHRNSPTSKPTLEVKIPPPLVALVLALLIWATSLAGPAFHFVLRGRVFVALALFLLGAIISIAGVISFRRAKTTVNPMKPGSASSLVISGVYKFTRNPMYLGLLFVLSGFVVLRANALALIWIPAFVLYMNRFQIIPEERALESLFKDEFLAYKAKVRRWA
jgi:protein-S-isoprenylcysteine O-methyltransferase Ste14